MKRGLFVAAHIADLHFSAFEAKKQYQILKEQFIPVIDSLPRLDMISVDGDIFDHKLMGSSEGIYYATQFIDDIINVARRHHSTIIMIHGTFSHDADQLKIFYHLQSNSDVDIRIRTQLSMEQVGNARILCIPELYGLDESEYNHFLHEDGLYDEALMHGTFEGSVYGNNVGQGRLFTIHDFSNCTGFMIAGHVHKPGCFEKYFYYCGTPYRYKFGEEEDKGFLITIHDLDTNWHYAYFNTIISDTYITLQLDNVKDKNPQAIIENINATKANQGIDFLKVRFNFPMDGADKTIIQNYYRTNPTVTVEFMSAMDERVYNDKAQGMNVVDDQYSFILDNSISDEEKFVRYVNMKEGQNLLTVEKLHEILNNDI